MVNAENISTFAKLIHIVQYILKQMILKYFCRTLGILLWVFMMASCLSSNTNEINPSKDAQIYSFSITSATDTNKYFVDSKFSIDQINGLIFNRDSLPYQFDVDSIMISLGNTSGFSEILVKLVDGDSSYSWGGKDSIALHRFKSIETTAGNGSTKLKYDVSINIHQQDPFIINWDNISGNYLNSATEVQKTISFKQQFITYYKTGGQVRASVASSGKGDDWMPITVSGLDDLTNLSSILSVKKAKEAVLYALDSNQKVFTSVDGSLWNEIASPNKVRTIYGELPFISGEFAILVAVEVDDELIFATTEDFLNFEFLNGITDSMPLDNFSAVSIDNPSVYSANYIILYGGIDVDGDSNDNIWIVQEKDGKIATISKELSIDIESAELFLYDQKVYMMASEEDGNKLYFSDNYGLDWKWSGENQAVDEKMQFRTDASILTDSDNFIWVFGGKSKSQTQIIDVWRGRLNKLAK